MSENSEIKFEHCRSILFKYREIIRIRTSSYLLRSKLNQYFEIFYYIQYFSSMSYRIKDDINRKARSKAAFKVLGNYVTERATKNYMKIKFYMSTRTRPNKFEEIQTSLADNFIGLFCTKNFCILVTKRKIMNISHRAMYT